MQSLNFFCQLPQVSIAPEMPLATFAFEGD